MAERPFVSSRFLHLEGENDGPIVPMGIIAKEKVTPATAPADESAEVNTVRDAVKGQAQPGESADMDPRLTTFRADYEKDSVLKGKITWTEIQTRLLANNGRYLALAQAMEQGGELFGVDAEDNPLICDRGDEPIMKGMNYKNTRDRVLYQHDQQDRMILGSNGEQLATGYEMFPSPGVYDKSPEVLQYEAHTGRPFVKDPNGREWRSSWVESGAAPYSPRAVRYTPDRTYTYGYTVADPQYDAPTRGVRRLLRVKKV